MRIAVAVDPPGRNLPYRELAEALVSRRPHDFMPDRRAARRRGRTVIRNLVRRTPLLALLVLATAQPGLARAQEPPPQTLTPEIYRTRCLFCHQSATPEGLDPSILGKIPANNRLKPSDLAAVLQCQRRCEHCGTPPQVSKPAEAGKK